MLGSELGPIFFALIAVFAQALVAWGLYVWGRWVARRQGRAWWRRAANMPLLAFAVGLVGIGLSSVLLLLSFGAVDGVEPARKAQVLADGIAQAMWPTAITAPLSGLLVLASLALFTYGSLKRPAEGAPMETSDR